MKPPLPPEILNLPLFQRAEMALKEAVAEVIEENVRNHWPIYIWRDGKVVDILPEKLLERSSAARAS